MREGISWERNEMQLMLKKSLFNVNGRLRGRCRGKFQGVLTAVFRKVTTIFNLTIKEMGALPGNTRVSHTFPPKHLNFQTSNPGCCRFELCRSISDVGHVTDN